MSIHQETRAKGIAYVVRYRQDGKNRSRAFPTKKEAQAFERALIDIKTKARKAQDARRLAELDQSAQGARF
jgi:hypothetical protein